MATKAWFTFYDYFQVIQSTWLKGKYSYIKNDNSKQSPDVKDAICSDRPTENYHPALKYPSALQTITAFFYLIASGL